MRTKLLIILLFVVIITNCCDKRSKNSIIVSDFNNCLLIIDEYDKYKGEINDTILGRFYFASEYLESLTQIKANFVFSEPPYYKNRETCLQDIREWENWFLSNKSHLTLQEMDSIKYIVVDKKVWWQDSSILRLVFQERRTQ